MSNKILHRRLMLALIVGSLTGCVFLAFTVRAYNHRTAKSRAAEPVAAKPVRQTNPLRRQVAAERVKILRSGFEPANITRALGPVVLFVDNRSGLQEVTLRLDRVAGPRLYEVSVPREVLDWNEEIDLTPGQYVLTEANHSDWVCRITVTPR